MANYVGQKLNGPKKLILAGAGITSLGVPIAIGFFLSMGNAGVMSAQSSAAVPQFQSVSIKPCTISPGMETRTGSSSPGHLSTGCRSLVDSNGFGLVQSAYVSFAGGHSNPFRILPIEGGSDWVHSQGFDIAAAAEGRPTVEMMTGPMLQAILEKQFQLRTRREIRQGPVYALTVSGLRSKLQAFEEGSCIRLTSAPASAPPPGQRYCDDLISARNPASINEEGITVEEFTQFLGLIMDRPVIDKTGLSGKYMFHLSFSRDQSTSRLPPLLASFNETSSAKENTIFAAMQEQLGLSLVPMQGPTEVLVIDNAEQPSQN